jgi:hypothetical protein
MISFLSCKKEAINLRSSMSKELFYTIEGKPYIVKTQTRYVNATIGGSPLNSYLTAIFDPGLASNVTGSGSAGGIGVNAISKIIPLHLKFSMRDSATGTILADISSVYYNLVRQVSPSIILRSDHRSAQSKVFPYVELLNYTNNNFYSYGLKYNQIYLSESDFFTPIQAIVYFFPMQADALNNDSGTFLSNPFIKPASTTIITTISITWLELQ